MLMCQWYSCWNSAHVCGLKCILGNWVWCSPIDVCFWSSVKVCWFFEKYMFCTPRTTAVAVCWIYLIFIDHFYVLQYWRQQFKYEWLNKMTKIIYITFFFILLQFQIKFDGLNIFSEWHTQAVLTSHMFVGLILTYISTVLHLYCLHKTFCSNIKRLI